MHGCEPKAPHQSRFTLLTSILTLLASCAPVDLQTSTIYGRNGQPLSEIINIQGEPGNIILSNLPEGLEFNPETRELLGTPLKPGLYSIQASTMHGPDELETTIPVIIEPMDHPVKPGKELVIIDPDVVLRSKQSLPGGSWHIKKAFMRIAGTKTPAETDAFFEQWISTWEQTQTHGKDSAGPRKNVKAELLNGWKQDRLKLIAIVNRLDLTKFQGNDLSGEAIKLGEGRFIYQLISATGKAENFTLILEFGLPLLDPRQSLDNNLVMWAKLWHMLSEPGINDSEHLARLEQVTAKFSEHGNLRQLRTNEKIADDAFEWEMREFALSGNSLVTRTVAQTPRDSLKDNTEWKYLGSYLKKHGKKVLTGLYSLSDSPEGRDIIGIKSSFPPIGSSNWKAPGADKRALYIFEFNTCNGCHKNNNDLNTPFQHIARNGTAIKADLSAFLSGELGTEYSLPGCDSRPVPWCKPDTWNEMAFRTFVLETFSSEGAISRTEKFFNTLPREMIFSSARYH